MSVTHWKPRLIVVSIALITWMNLTDSCSAQESPFVTVLGIAQDAGYPQAGCKKDCCAAAWKDPSISRHPVSIAVIDPQTKQRWLFECTPNFPDQLKLLDETFPVENSPGLDGIFLTHAHIGHYAGLIHVGHEVMGAKGVPVFAMPRMREYLSSNGPWDQLVNFKNIELQSLEANQSVTLNERLTVTPFTVPHRDEYSETVAFIITGPNKKILFLPDIDKWSRWETKIETMIEQVDVAFLDATFFDGEELPGRNMEQIPHPFIVESISRFQTLDESERSKVHFIHLNHTNPALVPDSPAREQIRRAGMAVAEQGMKIGL